MIRITSFVTTRILNYHSLDSAIATGTGTAPPTNKIDREQGPRDSRPVSHSLLTYRRPLGLLITVRQLDGPNDQHRAEAAADRWDAPSGLPTSRPAWASTRRATWLRTRLSRPAGAAFPAQHGAGHATSANGGRANGKHVSASPRPAVASRRLLAASSGIA